MPNEKVYFRNPYSFRAIKTTSQVLATGAIPILFEDDVTSPYHDNNNNFYTTDYIVPIAGIKQRFILEQISLTAAGFVNNIDIIIKLNGSTTIIQYPPFNLNSTSIVIPNVYTGYQTWAAGDRISVTIGHTSGALTLNPGTIFSNSFE